LRSILFPYVLNKCWRRLPEEGEIIATKHVVFTQFFCNATISCVALSADMPFSSFVCHS